MRDGRLRVFVSFLKTLSGGDLANSAAASCSTFFFFIYSVRFIDIKRFRRKCAQWPAVGARTFWHVCALVFELFLFSGGVSRAPPPYAKALFFILCVGFAFYFHRRVGGENRRFC